MGSGETPLQEGFPPQATAIARWVKTWRLCGRSFLTLLPTPYSPS